MAAPLTRPTDFLPRLHDGDEMSSLGASFNALAQHVEELTTKAEELGGFESLSRIAKLEVDLAHAEENAARYEHAYGVLLNRLTSIEERLGQHANVRLLRNLWRLSLVWLAMQVVYAVVKIALALKGHAP